MADFRVRGWDEEGHRLAKVYADLEGDSLNSFILGAIDDKLARLAKGNPRLTKEIRRKMGKMR